jgi:CRP-like cAMP-binding protein
LIKKYFKVYIRITTDTGFLSMIKKDAPSPEKWENTGGHSPLAVFFNAVHPISAEAVSVIDEETYPMTIQKGRYLVKPGSTGDSLFLILKGVVRAYIIEEGREITTWINEEHEIIGTIRNFGLSIPSEEYIQALETCELIVIPYKMVEYLYEHFPEANIIGRKLLEENYRGAEERAYISRVSSAEKKYKRFIETRQGLVNRVALKYVASYLGMTLETLSRIRNRRSL